MNYLSDLFWRRPRLLLALLLAPPLLWLGVIYIGALAALNFVFLAHRAMSNADAIVRTWWRLGVSRLHGRVD